MGMLPVMSNSSSFSSSSLSLKLVPRYLASFCAEHSLERSAKLSACSKCGEIWVKNDEDEDEDEEMCCVGF